MTSGLKRRKFIAITAAAAGTMLLPRSGCAAQTSGSPAAEWTGSWLGTVANIRLCHPDPDAGLRLIVHAVSEARRLERIFSLYDRDSLLLQLNSTGVLVAPPPELVELMTICDRMHAITGGLFDPTVQPLWTCYADHFAAGGPHVGPPSPAVLGQILAKVGWQRVRFNRDRIVLERGMGLTLNGIVQGYMTDRIVDILRAGGLESCLVDMGEIRATGTAPGGGPWRVFVRGSRDPLDAREVDGRGVATSAADGFSFDPAGVSNHLFDPATGHCAMPGRSLTVVAGTAAEADALSTAFALMHEARISDLLTRQPGVRVHIAEGAGLREMKPSSLGRA